MCSSPNQSQQYQTHVQIMSFLPVGRCPEWNTPTHHLSCNGIQLSALSCAIPMRVENSKYIKNPSGLIAGVQDLPPSLPAHLLNDDRVHHRDEDVRPVVSAKAPHNQSPRIDPLPYNHNKRNITCNTWHKKNVTQRNAAQNRVWIGLLWLVFSHQEAFKANSQHLETMQQISFHHCLAGLRYLVKKSKVSAHIINLPSRAKF